MAEKWQSWLQASISTGRMQDADKMSNTNFPTKQHIKSIFKISANEERSY